NRNETRRIEKPGPTGLMTTSTRSIASQLNTRMLEMSLPDDPGQTRAIMRAQALGVSEDAADQAMDFDVLLEFQRWLAGQGPWRVVVPFAWVLADLVSSTAVRMRRDFPQLLACIQTVALLNQHQRPRTAHNAVMATIDDYEHARRLLAPIFDTTA